MRNTRAGRQQITLAAGLLLAITGTARAQLITTNTTTGTSTLLSTAVPTAHVIEWDLTSLPDELDANPGAISVDTRGEDHNELWFITRLPTSFDSTPGGQRVYRFSPPESLFKDEARWTSWNLMVDPILAGGQRRVRGSHDRRFIVARTPGTIQRIDTRSCSAATAYTPGGCERVVWSFPGEEVIPFVSDVAVDDKNRIFSTGANDPVAFPGGYVQMIDPGRPLTVDLNTGELTVFVKRWADDNGAGQCQSLSSTLCNAGIDVHPSKQNLVYFVEVGAGGYIAELNTSVAYPSATNPNLRRWSLAKLSVYTDDSITEPRMLRIDRSGRVWVNTGSGHVVSLDPNTNRMTKHQVPEASTNDLWAVAPDDDAIGYTGANTNKVAMLFPKRNFVTVPPEKGFAPVSDFPAVVTKGVAEVSTGTVPGDAKIVPLKVERNTDGTFVEGLVDTNIYTSNPAATPSMMPLGITANRGKAQGTFFYTVGLAGDATNASLAKRIGFIRLPMKERAKFPRDDDDTDDGHDRDRHPSWHNSEPGDDDADGVPDQYDTKDREDMRSEDATPVAPFSQSASYPVTTSATSLALIASVEAESLTSTVAVDVYNALGALVATSGPMVGKALVVVPLPGAGTYNVRARNLGATAATLTPSFIVREPAVALP